MLDHLRMDIKGGGHKSTELFFFGKITYYDETIGCDANQGVESN